MFKRLVLLALLAGATVSVSAPAHARPAAASMTQGLVVVETTFYSDATYTVQVGYKILDQCSGDVYVEGTQTIYKIQKRTACTTY
jgi:hypothetical protein